MTIEEIKAELLTADTEGADRAAVYTSVLDHVAGEFAQRDEQISNQRNQLDKLTNTNLALLNRIKYQEDKPSEDEEIDAEEDEEAGFEFADLDHLV